MVLFDKVARSETHFGRHGDPMALCGKERLVSIAALMFVAALHGTLPIPLRRITSAAPPKAILDMQPMNFPTMAW